MGGPQCKRLEPAVRSRRLRVAPHWATHRTNEDIVLHLKGVVRLCVVLPAAAAAHGAPARAHLRRRQSSSQRSLGCHRRCHPQHSAWLPLGDATPAPGLSTPHHHHHTHARSPRFCTSQNSRTQVRARAAGSMPTALAS